MFGANEKILTQMGELNHLIGCRGASICHFSWYGAP